MLTSLVSSLPMCQWCAVSIRTEAERPKNYEELETECKAGIYLIQWKLPTWHIYQNKFPNFMVMQPKEYAQ